MATGMKKTLLGTTLGLGMLVGTGLTPAGQSPAAAATHTTRTTSRTTRTYHPSGHRTNRRHHRSRHRFSDFDQNRWWKANYRGDNDFRPNRDYDRDGIRNRYDRDIDGDGVGNNRDGHPFDRRRR